MGLFIIPLRNSALRLIGMRLLMYFSLYLCLSPAKQQSPNTCGIWVIVKAYVHKYVNFSSFYVLIDGRFWSLRTTNSVGATYNPPSWP
jgi:hypothetical protein